MDANKIIKEISLLPGAPIREAAGVIQDHEIKLVLVCDGDGRLVGTVTDGDIRRAVMNNEDMDSSVNKIMNRNPKVTRQHDNRWEIRESMRNSIVRHMPELDGDGKVISVFSLDGPEDVAPMPNAVVLFAGGQGTRLRPLTESVPKSLLDVGGKVVLERTVEQFIGHGFHKFYVSVHYMAEKIEAYFGDGSKWGVDIRYIREGKPLGTAGALALLEKQDIPFVVMNGDIITKVNFRAMVEMCQQDVAGVMGAREYLYTIPYGCMDIDGEKIVAVDEKPTQRHFINAGIYVLSPGAMEHFPEQDFFDMPDVFHSLIEAGKLIRHFYITEEWIDIGNKDDLAWARQLYGTGTDHD
jgi:dTDP-glucose pyrophosphorylase